MKARIISYALTGVASPKTGAGRLQRLAGASLLALLASGVALPALAVESFDFYANFHPNYDESNTLSLVIFGEEGTIGSITTLDGLSLDFTIDASGVFQTALDRLLVEQDMLGTVNGESVHVMADHAISGIALNRRNASSDQTILLDSKGLGKEYRLLAWTGLFDGYGSQVSMTAVADGTKVTITSPVDLVGGFLANTPFTVTLNKGESLSFSPVSGTADLTGMHIVGTANLAVFGGATCANVPLGVGACDHIISQNFSVDHFDKNFVLVPNFGGGTDGDLIRVIAAQDNTEIFLNGASQGILNTGEWKEIDKVNASLLSSSAPVMVGQYMRGEDGTRELGDPAFAIVPSTKQWLKSYVYATPVGAEVFLQNFINVAIDAAKAASLLLNGVGVDTSGFTTLGEYLVGNIAIEPGYGTISADVPFLAMISGFGDYDSYFSAIATVFSAGASPPPTSELPTTVAAYEAYPSALLNLTRQGSLRKRVGDRVVGGQTGGGVERGTATPLTFSTKGGPTGIRTEAWLRFDTQRLRSGLEGSSTDATYDQNFNQIQAGVDFALGANAGGDLVAGVNLSVGSSSMDIASPLGNFGIDTDLKGLGATLTWYGNDGFYVDAQANYLWFSSDLPGLTDSNSGTGQAASIEIGKRMAMGSTGWTVTPEGQLSYTKVSFDDFTGPVGETATMRDGESLRARIGATFDKTWAADNGGMNSMFLSASLIRENKGSTGVDVTAGGSVYEFGRSSPSNLIEIGMGGQFALNRSSYISGAVYAEKDLKDSDDRTDVRATLSLDLKW